MKKKTVAFWTISIRKIKRLIELKQVESSEIAGAPNMKKPLSKCKTCQTFMNSSKLASNEYAHCSWQHVYYFKAKILSQCVCKRIGKKLKLYTKQLFHREFKWFVSIPTNHIQMTPSWIARCLIKNYTIPVIRKYFRTNNHWFIPCETRLEHCKWSQSERWKFNIALDLIWNNSE